MEFKLTEQETQALRLLASLGSVYQPLFEETKRLSACGLVQLNRSGSVCLTTTGYKYLRHMTWCIHESPSFEPNQIQLHRTDSGIS